MFDSQIATTGKWTHLLPHGNYLDGLISSLLRRIAYTKCDSQEECDKAKTVGESKKRCSTIHSSSQLDVAQENKQHDPEYLELSNLLGNPKNRLANGCRLEIAGTGL